VSLHVRFDGTPREGRSGNTKQGLVQIRTRVRLE